MSHSAKFNFVEQQGFEKPGGPVCEVQYNALMFQPRLVGVFVLVGLIVQSWLYFLILSVVLWWNVVFPALNPFDAVYNRFIAGPGNSRPLTPAPAPRRFAQGMAGTFMLGIAIGLLLKRPVLTGVLEAFLVAAVSALVFGRFCLGSYLYHIFKGHTAFANRTLPWTRTN